MYKNCIHLLRIENEWENYCFKLKIQIDRCPSKCVYYSHGEPANIDEIKQNQLNYKCKHFTRVKGKQGILVYACSLLNFEDPFCDKCPSPEYENDVIGNSPFPYLYYSPYPKGPPTTNASTIPTLIICPSCHKKYNVRKPSCPSCGYKFLH